MFLIIGATIAAATGAVMGNHGAHQARRHDATMAANQMGFQERMFKNRYQMQMQDMKAAGLNPILAFKQSPPGAPSGASPGPTMNAGAAAVASAMQLSRLAADVRNVEAQAAKTEAETDKINTVGSGFMADAADFFSKLPEGMDKRLREKYPQIYPLIKELFQSTAENKNVKKGVGATKEALEPFGGIGPQQGGSAAARKARKMIEQGKGKK